MCFLQKRVAPSAVLSATDPRTRMEHLLTLASYAPSVHNAQPWLVTIESPTTAVISADDTRKIPVADPTDRGRWIALGAFAENAFLAADALGLDPVLTVSDAPAPTITFTIKETPAPKPDAAAWLAALAERRTNRGPFAPLPQAKQFCEDAVRYVVAESAVSFLTEHERIAALADLIKEGTRLAYGDKAFCVEHAQWIRTSATLRKDGIPGYAIGVPFLVSFLVPSGIKHKDMSAPRSAQEHAKALSGSAFFCVESDDTPPGWIAAGRTLARLMTLATRAGIAVSPNAAPIEMGNLRSDVASLFHATKKPQLLLRLGTAIRVTPPPPRRPVSAFAHWA